MELLQISGQKGQSLREFYSPEKWPETWGKMPQMMSELITVLKTVEHDPIWVFTSHAELLFTSEDDYQNWKVLVKIIEADSKQFYKVTAVQKKPWHHLTGFADNSKLASELVISGLLVSDNSRNRNIFLDAN
jgi:hypothetical protein